MNAFSVHRGIAAPLRRTNVDTDQIIPAVYLKRVTRSGFEDGLFAAWRANEPDFVLNNPLYVQSSILVADNDFGTGSSREHAVWALLDYGFRVVIAPRFGDIFRNNATKAGLVPVEVSPEIGAALLAAIKADPTLELIVDIDSRTVGALRAGIESDFPLDDFTRMRLLEGLDDIGLTLRNVDAIARYEADRPGWLPRVR